MDLKIFFWIAIIFFANDGHVQPHIDKQYMK